MNDCVLVKSYPYPPVNQKEILRYSGCKNSTDELCLLIEKCINDSYNSLVFKVCYREFDITVENDVVDFGFMKVPSSDLCKNLCKCNKAIVFCATVGIELDRLIKKYERIAPSKAVMLHAFGSERVEALCDAFCDDIKAEYDNFNINCCTRFSPGYGDFDIKFQKDIFRALEISKNIGVSLNDNLFMTPSKSVTAIIGLKEK